MVQTQVLLYTREAIDRAARLILDGQLVAIPTETVYGLAADAGNGEAVARIYAAKGRPAFNPLIVHVSSLDQALALGQFVPEAIRLAERHWPGPLTLVVPRKEGEGVSTLALAGLSTIALRSPAHPAIRDLLEATGRPLAAPSANASGRISPTRAHHVLASLGGRIPLVVDGGATVHGVESTILAIDKERRLVLRPGPIDLGEAAGVTQIEAPGQLESHYAPAKPVRLGVSEAQQDEWLIGFGPVQGHSTLSRSGDLVEAAARLFDLLHQAEARGEARIAIAPVPETGLGVAINDRLRRAAAPREPKIQG